MPQRAHVTSVEAIEAFRANLIIYLSKARPALEEVSADVQRVRLWIENDQRTHWEGEVRRRTKQLEQATQELFSARISNLSEATAAQQLAVHRAKRSLDEATEKLRVLKRWNRDFDGMVQPHVKQVEKLHTVFTNDMVQALAYLATAIKTLSEYAEIAPPSALNESMPAGAPSAEPSEAAEEKTPAPGRDIS
jgi:uncharacterized coiled-coil protein SlyX